MPRQDAPPLTKGVVLRGLGVALAVALAAIAVWLIVTNSSRKMFEIGVVAGLWSALIGAFAMFGARRAQEAAPSQALVPARLAELEVSARRDFEERLQQLLRREIDSAVGREMSVLRNEISQLRHDLLEKVGGQLRLERIEVTRVIGSDLEALQDEVRQLKSASARVVEPARTRPVLRSAAPGDVIDADDAPAAEAAPPVRDEHAERDNVQRAEADRTAARAEAERVAAERAAVERAEAERVQAERAEAERVRAEHAEAERAAAERAEAERAEADRVQAERSAAERVAAERAAAERAEAERVAAERAEADRAQAQRVAAERAAAERARREREEAERAKLERARAERDRARAEREAVYRGGHQAPGPSEPHVQPLSHSPGGAPVAVPYGPPAGTPSTAQVDPNDPFASLPRLTPFTDIEPEPEPDPTDYSGRRRRNDPGEAGGGRRRRAEDEDDNLLARLLAREIPR